jgi:hypothetical protein
MAKEARPFLLLAENVVEKFRDLRRQQIARPLQGNLLERRSRTQMIAVQPARQRVMKTPFSIMGGWQQRRGDVQYAAAAFSEAGD